MISTINCATTIANDALVFRHMKNAANLHYHFTFTTPTSLAFAGDWRELFYRFIAHCIRAANAVFIDINSTNQTLLFSVRLPSTCSPDKFARRLKILSANWLQRKAGLPNFTWSEDYEAVTLDPKRMNNFHLHRDAN